MASLRLVTMTIKAFRGKGTKHTNPRYKQAKKKANQVMNVNLIIMIIRKLKHKQAISCSMPTENKLFKKKIF